MSTVILASLIISIILLINIMAGICLCCHPEKDKLKDQGFAVPFKGGYTQMR